MQTPEQVAAHMLRKRAEELARRERGIAYVWRKIVRTVTGIFKKT